MVPTEARCHCVSARRNSSAVGLLLSLCRFPCFSTGRREKCRLAARVPGGRRASIPSSPPPGFRSVLITAQSALHNIHNKCHNFLTFSLSRLLHVFFFFFFIFRTGASFYQYYYYGTFPMLGRRLYNPYVQLAPKVIHNVRMCCCCCICIARVK